MGVFFSKQLSFQKKARHSISCFHKNRLSRHSKQPVWSIGSKYGMIEVKAGYIEFVEGPFSSAQPLKTIQQQIHICRIS